MAPGYRNQNRRQNHRAGIVDHDVFEGLPVRQWRRDEVTVVPPPAQENITSQNDIWAVELPHGMPKDSHLLPQHSQDLLRAARSGKLYKRHMPVEEEDAYPEALLGDKPEKKEDDPKDRGFTAKAWKQIGRHAEGPDIDFLAKRRKGVVTAASRAATIAGTLTKTKVKRVDAAGNEYFQDIVLPRGQPVEGEVISQTVVTDTNVVEPYSHPTPSRKKGPSSRKKPNKGPGRGRKKKQNPSTPTTAISEVQTVTGAAPIEGSAGHAEAEAIKIEEGTNATSSNHGDTEMGDGSVAASDEEEDGDEGDDGDEEEGHVDSHISPSKYVPVPFSASGTLPTMKPIPSFGPADARMTGMEIGRPPLIQIERGLDAKFGSPLKNVALTQSTLTSPLDSPTLAEPFSEIQTTKPSEQSSASPTTANIPPLEEVIKQEPQDTAPTTPPPSQLQPKEVDLTPAVEVRQEEEKEKATQPDIVEDTRPGESDVTAVVTKLDEKHDEPPSTTVVKVPSPPAPVPAVEEPAAPAAPPEPAEEPAPAAVSTPPAAGLASTPIPASAVIQEPNQDDDGDFPDLLGSLEKSLQKAAK